MTIFADRTKELELLENLWSSDRAVMLVVYGRRRIGKTLLLKKFLEGKRGVYLLAEEVEEKELMREFSERIAEALDLPILKITPIDTWRKLLKLIANYARKERLLVIIDEFQYAVRVNPALLSMIQALWDEELSKTKIMLVLCGSIVSFIEDKVLSEKAPLYGRITSNMRIEELSPLYIPAFTPNWDNVDHIRAYTVFGGIPGYLASIDPEKTLWDNIRDLVLRKNSPYFDEAKKLLREEVREVVRYYSILEAVASGATRFSEILNHTGIPRESLYKYIQILVEMNILEKQSPILGKAKPVYRIRDRFLQFWFRYNARYRTALELELEDKVLEHVRQDLDKTLTPSAWEEVTKHIVVELIRNNEIDITPTRIGKWWHRDKEVDLVVVDDINNKLLVGEAKWSKLSLSDARRIAYRLEEVIEEIPYKPKQTLILVSAPEIADHSKLVEEGIITITMDTYRRLSKNKLAIHGKRIK